MVRRTIMETRVTVEEQKLRPRKSEVMKRIKTERAIAQGITQGIMVLSTAVVVRVGLLVYEVLNSRSGGLGGEILVFPALVLAFCWGMEIGGQRERKQWEGSEEDDTEAEYRATGTESR